jgi:hypothetical protein
MTFRRQTKCSLCHAADAPIPPTAYPTIRLGHGCPKCASNFCTPIIVLADSIAEKTILGVEGDAPRNGLLSSHPLPSCKKRYVVTPSAVRPTRPTSIEARSSGTGGPAVSWRMSRSDMPANLVYLHPNHRGVESRVHPGMPLPARIPRRRVVRHAQGRQGEQRPVHGTCRSRIRGQAATGSWTRSLQ